MRVIWGGVVSWMVTVRVAGVAGLAGHFWDPGRGVGTRWVWDGGRDGVGTGGVGTDGVGTGVGIGLGRGQGEARPTWDADWPNPK